MILRNILSIVWSGGTNNVEETLQTLFTSFRSSIFRTRECSRTFRSSNSARKALSEECSLDSLCFGPEGSVRSLDVEFLSESMIDVPADSGFSEINERCSMLV